MVTMLIVMYILQANGQIVPEGCFIAAWVLLVLRIIINVMKELCED